MAVKAVSVSQLNSYIKRILQTDPLLGNISVVGEISNLKFHQSGHVYFSMKDAKSKINCFLPSSVLAQLRYELVEGMEITAVGYVSVYEPGGYYSLNVKDVFVAGMGNLAVAFEQLKAKLEKEGLFSPDHKKEISAFPKTISVITAETGAAVRDIVKIITEKNDYVDILIFPVIVQGPKAAGEIAQGIEAVNRHFPETDTIIVGRGGGSMEDLWAFNEEVVARAIYASEIPVISAVGHEVDFTISDFVADLRAETPTAAANMAVPDMRQIRQYLDDQLKNLHLEITRKVDNKTDRLERSNLDIFARMIQSKIDYQDMRIRQLRGKIQDSLMGGLEERRGRIQLLQSRLEGTSPMGIMERGYSAVTRPDGSLVKGIQYIYRGEELVLHMSDGRADVQVKETERNKK